MITKAAYLLCLVLAGAASVAQVPFDGLTYFGIGLKPIVPNAFFGNGPETFETPDFTTDFVPRPGFAFGMNVRHELSNMWAIQTGIYYVRRNFRIDILDPLTGFRAEMPYTFINYEIPIEGLIYVRLKKQLYMNASTGLSFDAYPSNVESIQFEYEQKTIRRRWIQLALAANLGFEYRTKEKGFLYFGASYHAPTDDIAVVRVRYSRDGFPYYSNFAMNGSYLTLDLKYFFHSDPYDSSNQKPRKKRKIGQ